MCLVTYTPNKTEDAKSNAMVAMFRLVLAKAAPALACTRFQFLGLDFPPRTTSPSIPLESVNWCRTCLGRAGR